MRKFRKRFYFKENYDTSKSSHIINKQPFTPYFTPLRFQNFRQPGEISGKIAKKKTIQSKI